LIKLNSIFSLILFLGSAKHGPRCKIFSENHLHPKQTQPESTNMLSIQIGKKIKKKT